MRRIASLLFLAPTVLLAAPARAQAPPAIAAGASVAGLDVGGLTVDAAAARIEAALGAKLRSTLEVRVGGHHLHLTRQGGGLDLDARASAERALETGGAVQPVVTAKLDRFLDRLQRAGTREPRNAKLRYTVTKLKVTRSLDGLRLDRDAARARVEAAIADPASPRIIRVPLQHLEPEVTRADLVEKYPTVVTVHRRGFRLRLFKDLEPAASYPVAVGMPGHVTPTGRYLIANKAVDPAWTAPDKPWAGAYRNEVVAGGSAENPLKARWLGIVNGVGIHGTDATWTLGRAASHGCIRMSVPAVKALYARVPVGALVMIK
jgi:lipoprotein-anchoring transpeptidase ErfK/SrfK